MSDSTPQTEPRTASVAAPGKVILVGEHAVVYGRPALAVPVWQTVATAQVQAQSATDPARGLLIVAQDIGRTLHLRTLDPGASPDEPLLVVARHTLAALGMAIPPNWRVTLHSQIPMASGMGSGAALSAALARGLFEMAGVLPEPAHISQLVYAGEEIYHGTPSGIDNTVVAYGQPIWFRKGEPPQVVKPARAFNLAIADNGVPASTRATVGHVRQLWQADPSRFDAIFTRIGELVAQARRALESGDRDALGAIFDANQDLLQQLEVSTPGLERLIEAARVAGARGAKLSGGGGGGNVIALVEDDTQEAVSQALYAAGAARVILTQIDNQA
jgi:mevalonate kinase